MADDAAPLRSGSRAASDVEAAYDDPAQALMAGLRCNVPVRSLLKAAALTAVLAVAVVSTWPRQREGRMASGAPISAVSLASVGSVDIASAGRGDADEIAKHLLQQAGVKISAAAESARLRAEEQASAKVAAFDRDTQRAKADSAEARARIDEARTALGAELLREVESDVLPKFPTAPPALPAAP